ncbi:hypothetical protein ACNKHU_19115 [Shigella flexneri]
MKSANCSDSQPRADHQKKIASRKIRRRTPARFSRGEQKGDADKIAKRERKLEAECIRAESLEARDY